MLIFKASHMPSLPTKTQDTASYYTNKELEAGIVEFRTSTMPKDNNGKVLNLKFYDLMVKLIGMRYWHITTPIRNLNALLDSPIQNFLNADKERWCHYFEYINDSKRDSEYKQWYSHKKQKEFAVMRTKWKIAIAMLQTEYHDLEKMAAMTEEEYREYLKSSVTLRT